MSINDDVAFLESVPSLRLLGPAALRILAIGSENRTLDAGEVLFKAGDVADAGFVVQDGSFNLTGPDGLSVQEGIASAGAVLGEYALITPGSRPFTATAAEPATVIRISRSLFVKMLEGYPDAAARLRDHMAARSIQTVNEMQKAVAALASKRK